MSNDNKKPSVGDALFNMLGDMGRAQAKIYSERGCTPQSMQEAREVVMHLEQMHRPIVLSSIKRISK